MLKRLQADLVNVRVLFLCDDHSSSVLSYVIDNFGDVHRVIILKLVSCYVNG